MMFEAFFESFFERRHPSGPLERLPDGRLCLDVAGITIIMREVVREVTWEATTHECEVEEIRLTTWQYQVLPEHLRVELADVIRIIEP